MEQLRSVHEMKQFGSVKITLDRALEKSGITRNKLSTLTDVKYQLVDRYYKNQVERVDLHFLAKVCYVLGCEIDDLLEYQPETEK